MKSIAFALGLLAAGTANAGITIVNDPGISSIVRTEYFPSITVKVTDANGKPAPGVSVAFSNSAGIAWEYCNSACSVTTAVDGTAFIGRVRGMAVGDWALSISAYTWNGTSTTHYGDLLRPLKVLAVGAPMVLEAIDGDNQSAIVGQPFAKPVTVRVTKGGQPLSSVDVQFSWDAGAAIRFSGIASTPVKVTTDANGIAKSPALVSSYGLGHGKLVFAAYDNVEASLMKGGATLKVTDAAGNTSQPLAPLWWAGPADSGWGLSVPQHGERIFPVLFTYRSGQPTWYVLNGSWGGGFGVGFGGTLDRYTGAPYYAFDTTKVEVSEQWSTVTFGFPSFGTDLTKATLAGVDWNQPLGRPLGTYSIVPFRFASATARPAKGVSDIWWGGPAQSGWGISIAEDGGNLFAAWFTYGADGNPIWFSMPEGAWVDENTWKGPVYRTVGSGPYAFLGTSGTPYSATNVGDFTLQFSGTSAATFQYNVEGHSGTLKLQRFDY